MTSSNQNKTIEFSVYKYEHPDFGPLMLLLDVDEKEESEDKKLKPSFHRFRDEIPESKASLFNRYDSQENNESIDNDRKRRRPPLQPEKRTDKLQIGGASIEKIERRSVERKSSLNKYPDNPLLLPSIAKKK